MSDTQIDYTQARAMLNSDLPCDVEKRHLEALEEHYQCELVRVAYDMDKLATELRQRN